MHAEKLRRKWRPRRIIRDAREARVVLVAMETWEAWSLIPGVLSSFDAVHVPIVDTMDRSVHDAQQRAVVEQFSAAHAARPVDLVLVYATNAQIAATTLSRIAESGALVAVMCLDDKHAFVDHRPSRAWPAGQAPLIGSAHVHLSSSRECLRWYDVCGTSAFYWPEAANPEFGAGLQLPQDIEVSFVGQKYGHREHFVKNLRNDGIAIECFGRGWENPPLSNEEMFRVYARSKIVLGLGYVGTSKDITTLKGRDFDVPASGNFYLTTFDYELSQCFKIGEEIACYRNEAECPEVIRYYLERPDERRVIAKAGRARVLRDHTWPVRVESLLRTVGALDIGRMTPDSATEAGVVRITS